ncbi:MAG: methyl-accepting chemotaxis protein [Planctomycetota bacterium]|nr:methyl-accepting chemotaxis protein [Planctomycetota bacterium]MDA1249114.1 methyl-accepting chemotaxis protein [Planctomycetota bacterium]
MPEPTSPEATGFLDTLLNRLAGLSLRWQISAFACLSVLVSLFAMGSIAFSESAAILTDMTLSQFETEATAAVQGIERTLQESRIDVLQTPQFPPVPGIIRCLDANGTDPEQAGSTLEVWVERLETIASAQMRQRPARISASLVGASGEELMRVERRGSVVAPAETLSDFSTDDAFIQRALKASPDQVIISAMERTGGQQVLRLATPYFDLTGQARGVFVIALDGDVLLRSGAALIVKASVDIVDETGAFLLSRDTPQNVVNSTLYKDVKPVRAKLLADPSSPDSFRELIDGHLRPDGVTLLGTYQKFHYAEEDPSRFWAVAVDVPADQALIPVTNLAWRFWMVGSLIIVAAIIVSLFGATGLTSALGTVTRTADEIAGGNLDARMPAIRPIGEIRTLADSVRAMAARLRTALQDTREKEKRTAAILNSTADAILTIDTAGKVLSANAAAGKLFRVSVVELTDSSAGRFVPALTSSEAQFDSSELAAGEIRMLGGENEVEGLRSDGSRVSLSLRVAEMEYSGERLFIATIQDITERHRIEVERQRIFDAVRSAVKRLAAASSEIQAQTTQQAATASQQASSIAETTSTVKEIAETASQSTSRAEEVAGSARRADEVSRSGRDAVEETISAMKRVREQTETTAQNILTLSERAQTIGNLIATVNEIADQTNLLALNAAIEASRAGEHGKGFAVVATEVKTLAGQSRKATDQVRQILGEIQQATNTAVMSTEQGTRSVESAEKVVGRASQTISELAKTISEAARAAQQIVASAGQQATGMEQIRDAMSQIDVATRQTLTATRQTEESARDMARLGQELQSLVTQSAGEDGRNG